MKLIYLSLLIVTVSGWGCGGLSHETQIDAPEASFGPASSPLEATYLIGGEAVRLVDGHAEAAAAPGSAARVQTDVLGEPVHGDLDGDGDEDVALFLVHQPGGSGTFVYLAAAIHVDSGFVGTNAVLLGDRVFPQQVTVRNGIAFAEYADRRPGEPMAAVPTVPRTGHLTLEGGRLVPLAPLKEDEKLVEGWVTIGHEVRSFRPCSDDRELWLLGRSPALDVIVEAHRDAIPSRGLYAPLFMVLTGTFADPPQDGFGADYGGAFLASRLVHVWNRGNCRNHLIVVESPSPGSEITSPLRVTGRARGTWFFEGDFPLVLSDAKGRAIARGYATAQGEWMTRSFVPFDGTLEFASPGSRVKGALRFIKDNPTDRPDLDDAVEIPVRFR